MDNFRGSTELINSPKSCATLLLMKHVSFVIANLVAIYGGSRRQKNLIKVMLMFLVQGILRKRFKVV